ncbi:MAG: hypothetical protein Q4A21_00155 [bacterium]|nr:hypothetical protein [bacterium]
MLETTKQQILLGTILKMYIRRDIDQLALDWDTIEEEFDKAWLRFLAVENVFIKSKENETFENLMKQLKFFVFVEEVQRRNYRYGITKNITHYRPTNFFLNDIISFKIKEF